ncbi:hypothetical protein [Microvirga zambiensis]|uniref:hypothetical protein n=1 Tax=Microvirga zambiensis TaxID=1402137 RepID=UPI00191CC52D|nr:hypothetical protein [Microvirga zambiensis]
MATLTRRAKTVEVQSFVDAAVRLLEGHETSTGIRQRKRTEAAQTAFLRAVEAFLGDLLLGAKIGRGGWVFRSRHAKSFSGGEVTYRQFIAVAETMEALGLIEVVDGFNAMKTISWEGGQTSRYQQGKAARYRASKNLLDLAVGMGVEAQDVGRHFQETTPTKLIVLKDSSRRFGRDKIPGRPMSLSPTATVERLMDQVRLINEFLDGIDIQGGIHKGFYRVFNLGDHPGFDWNKGGRLYSIGIDNYQRLKEKDRLGMTLDGESVAEIDISGSYLTALHGLLGQPLKIEGDLYNVPGIPRSIVKGWLVATLSNAGHLKRWPKDKAADFVEETGQSLSETYSIKAVREAMIANYPVLDAWGQVEIDWGDLMFRESEAVIGTMVHLIKAYQIPALPVHDSLLVPASKVGLCRNLLVDHYKYSCKIEPRVTVDFPEGWVVEGS